MRLDKIRRVWNSDLLPLDRLRFLFDELRERLHLPALEVREYRLRGGALVRMRWTSTDSKVFDEVFLEKIYEPLAAAIPSHARPGVLVDLGANIGLSSLFLEFMLHFEHIIAVEPDRGNLRMLRQNLDQNVSAEVSSIQAFAGAERGYANLLDEGYGAWGLRMGALSDHGIPVLPMSELIPHVPGGVLLKCDIEGAERQIFPDIAEWDEWVSFIILELHTEFFTAEQLQQALATSRYEWHMHGAIPTGALLAVFALERGALKAEPLQSGSDSRSHSRGAAAV
jgi:FkbM family methyltransferase